MGAKVFESQNRIVDKETGEQLSLETKIVKTVSIDNFIQIYLEDLAGLFKIDNMSEYKVIIWLWKKSTFNAKNSGLGNKIFLVKSEKEEIAKETNLSYSRVNNIISELVKKNLLIKLGRSVYVLNPQYFFKGYLTDRPQVIRTIIEYKIQNPKKEKVTNETDAVSNS